MASCRLIPATVRVSLVLRVGTLGSFLVQLDAGQMSFEETGLSLQSPDIQRAVAAALAAVPRDEALLSLPRSSRLVACFLLVEFLRRVSFDWLGYCFLLPLAIVLSVDSPYYTGMFLVACRPSRQSFLAENVVARLALPQSSQLSQ